jgi:hypothetical protein
MSGMTLRALEKTTYQFTGANQIQATKTVTIPVAVNVDLSQFTWAGLVLRVHSFSISSTGTGTVPGVTANLYNSAPTAEDPALVFRVSTPTITGTAIAGTGSATVGPLLQVNMATAAGLTAGFADVLLTFSGWGTTGTSDINITVSVDLVLKS